MPAVGVLGGAEPADAGVGPVGVVVDAPVLDDDLGLEEGVEQLAVEELVAEAAVEALDPGVLPRAARVDEDRVGAVEPAPVGDGMGDELGPVIEPQVRRGAALGGDPVQGGDDLVGVDVALRPGSPGTPG